MAADEDAKALEQSKLREMMLARERVTSGRLRLLVSLLVVVALAAAGLAAIAGRQTQLAAERLTWSPTAGL